jgi:hypothetical protein
VIKLGKRRRFIAQSSSVIPIPARRLPDNLAEAFRKVKLVGKARPLRDSLERQGVVPQQNAGLLDAA